jgi:hypothetical protein
MHGLAIQQPKFSYSLQEYETVIGQSLAELGVPAYG